MSAWIEIEKRSDDFGREPKAGYIVSWIGQEENFRRVVGSMTELLSVLRPILARNDADVKAYFANKANAEAVFRRAEALELKRQIKM